jgi:hypothetical protein
LYKIFGRLTGYIPQHYRIVVEFMDVVILYVFVIEGINGPNKNAGNEFKVEKDWGYNRFKIFEL